MMDTCPHCGQLAETPYLDRCTDCGFLPAHGAD